ncbi:MAG: hypothetical protein IKS92_11725, partial [Victivallales bacterium]|nr:hypothetical protein [Victivallales bacterium]
KYKLIKTLEKVKQESINNREMSVHLQTTCLVYGKGHRETRLVNIPFLAHSARKRKLHRHSPVGM